IAARIEPPDWLPSGTRMRHLGVMMAAPRGKHTQPESEGMCLPTPAEEPTHGPGGRLLRYAVVASAGLGGSRWPSAPDGFPLLDGNACARCARYDLPLIFTMIAPSTSRSRIAIASGASPRYSPHASKSMFVTSAVERFGLRASISLYSKLAACRPSRR